jgi:hypothetical protein
MVKMFSTLLMIASLSIFQTARHCSCEKAERWETTHWGWVRERPVDGGTVKQIRGRVLVNGDMPLESALVEIYDHPEIQMSEDLPRRGRKQRRIAACKTGRDGAFCFTGIKPGRYEVRGSKREYNAGTVVVTLAPKDKQASAEVKILVNVSN